MIYDIKCVFRILTVSFFYNNALLFCNFRPEVKQEKIQERRKRRPFLDRPELDYRYVLYIFMVYLLNGMFDHSICS